MSNTEHTPGPWLFTDPVKPSGGRYIRQAPETGGAHEIAFVGYWETPRGEANARLIAAAPELLRELRRVHAALGGECFDWGPTLEVIAKAGGAA
ncbi:hypothetical protein [Caldimonas brevitalea]|uniref:Uncharacterized protein n=1 Tax=Caldimonas brevitalea TaxID=413882 RepID=A0A0G3BLG5_9BURK|nr:hypothetical protein [Caldimonas brevitalea]AKJ28808.1 hypothetical protein AAW51_2117 [Caldimonas brevitalea]